MITTADGSPMIPDPEKPTWRESLAGRVAAFKPEGLEGDIRLCSDDDAVWVKFHTACYGREKLNAKDLGNPEAEQRVFRAALENLCTALQAKLDELRKAQP